MIETSVRRAAKVVRLAGARAGLDLARRPAPLSHPGIADAADLDYVAAHLMQQRGTSQLTFVQVGAFDGSANDPLRHLVLAHGWQGVLVEPQPGPFARLTANYEGVDGLTFVNAVVASEPGTVPFYSITPGPGIPPWAQQIASLDEAAIRRQAWRSPAVREAITSSEVQAVTLADLFTRAGGNVDILQIDCEGYDAAVIGMLDLSAAKSPAVIRFEHQHLHRDDFVTVCNSLMAAGYELHQGHEDTLAYRRAATAVSSTESKTPAAA